MISAQEKAIACGGGWPSYNGGLGLAFNAIAVCQVRFAAAGQGWSFLLFCHIFPSFHELLDELRTLKKKLTLLSKNHVWCLRVISLLKYGNKDVVMHSRYSFSAPELLVQDCLATGNEEGDSGPVLNPSLKAGWSLIPAWLHYMQHEEMYCLKIAQHRLKQLVTAACTGTKTPIK